MMIRRLEEIKLKCGQNESLENCFRSYQDYKTLFKRRGLTPQALLDQRS